MLLVTSLIAGAIAGGLVEYLLGLRMPEKPGVRHMVAIGVFILIFASISIWLVPEDDSADNVITALAGIQTRESELATAFAGFMVNQSQSNEFAPTAEAYATQIAELELTRLYLEATSTALIPAISTEEPRQTSTTTRVQSTLTSIPTETYTPEIGETPTVAKATIVATVPPVIYPTSTPTPAFTPSLLVNYMEVIPIEPLPGESVIPGETPLVFLVRYSLDNPDIDHPDAYAEFHIDIVSYESPDCTSGGPLDIDELGRWREFQVNNNNRSGEQILSLVGKRFDSNIKSISVSIWLYGSKTGPLKDDNLSSRCYPVQN